MSSDRHQTIDNTHKLLQAIMERYRHEPTTSELASAADVHRDTARRLLRGMAEVGWVRLIIHPDGERWGMGGGLVSMALTYQRLMVDHMEDLQDRYDRLGTPKAKRHALHRRAQALADLAEANS